MMVVMVVVWCGGGVVVWCGGVWYLKACGGANEKNKKSMNRVEFEV